MILECDKCYAEFEADHYEITPETTILCEACADYEREQNERHAAWEEDWKRD